jgi:hypothetical protein
VNTTVDCLLVLKTEEVMMSWEIDKELSYQRIAELHADAERVRRVRMSKRGRQRRSRGRLGRLLWPTRAAVQANVLVGGNLDRPSRRDPMEPSRLNPGLGC